MEKNVLNVDLRMLAIRTWQEIEMLREKPSRHPVSVIEQSFNKLLLRAWEKYQNDLRLALSAKRTSPISPQDQCQANLPKRRP